MTSSIKSCLSQADLFYGFSDQHIENLAAICEQATLPKGFALIEEKENTDALFLVAQGGVDIWLNPAIVSARPEVADLVKVAELKPGQVFGEIALVDQGIRSATALTNQDNTIVLRLPRKALMELCDNDLELGYKLMKNLAADLALKLRNTDLTIRQYQLMLRQASK
jgi:CRP/FNR family cyclic AMP-dependent transcriptional regulator